MDKIKTQVERALREAGRLMTESSFDGQSVIVKGTANFVTHIDYKVQDYLFKELKHLIPESNFIAEESDCNNYCLEKPTWILDPVDGTTNLMYGYNHSAISLLLLIDGKPELAFIFNPSSREMFFAQAGKGAYLNDNRICVSKNERIQDCLIAFGTSPYDRSEGNNTLEITGKVFKSCRDVRRSGSAALDIAYVACGRLDGYYEMMIQPWDYAAGVLILKEAGGSIKNWKNLELSMLSPDSVIASNGLVHNAILDLIKL